MFFSTQVQPYVFAIVSDEETVALAADAWPQTIYFYGEVDTSGDGLIDG